MHWLYAKELKIPLCRGSIDYTREFFRVAVYIRCIDYVRKKSCDFLLGAPTTTLHYTALHYWKLAGVTKILVSGIVVNNKLTNDSDDISNMCRDNSFVFIDNNKIPTSSLFRDGLHLLEIRKRILANSLIDNLSFL